MTPIRPAEAGFTVIDMIVSLILLALMMALVPTALRLAQQGPVIAAELDRRAAVDAGISFVVQRLTEATPLFQRGDDGRLQIAFSGTQDSISFLAPVRFDANTNGLGQFSVQLGLQGLNLSWRPWFPTQGGQAAPIVNLRDRVIVPAATSVSLRYFGQKGTSALPEWVTTWESLDALPDLVELTVAVSDLVHVRRVELRLRQPQ